MCGYHLSGLSVYFRTYFLFCFFCFFQHFSYACDHRLADQAKPLTVCISWPINQSTNQSSKQYQSAHDHRSMFLLPFLGVPQSTPGRISTFPARRICYVRSLPQLKHQVTHPQTKQERKARGGTSRGTQPQSPLYPPPRQSSPFATRPCLGAVVLVGLSLFGLAQRTGRTFKYTVFIINTINITTCEYSLHSGCNPAPHY